MTEHKSDCATNNGPAVPAGPCDCKQATPKETLRSRLLDPRVPKTEAEHFAGKEIGRLERELAKANIDSVNETARANDLERELAAYKNRFSGITAEWGKRLKLETMETLLNGGSRGAENVARLVCAWDNEKKRAEQLEASAALMFDALLSWCVKDYECGCDTASCQGTCAPAKTRNAISRYYPPPPPPINADEIARRGAK